MIAATPQAYQGRLACRNFLMQLAVISVAREPSYLDGTLESLRETAPGSLVDLFIGSPNTAYAEHLRGDPDLVMFEMPPEMWQRIEGLKSYQRAAGNFLEALRRPHTGGPVLLIEDDIIFRHGWLDALVQGIHDHPTAIITLYVSPHAHARGLPSDVPFAPLAPLAFHGSLALYIPYAWRGELAAYIDRELEAGDAPFDDLVSRFIATYSVPFVTSTKSWVDHRGDVSAIFENRDHGIRRSPRF